MKKAGSLLLLNLLVVVALLVISSCQNQPRQTEVDIQQSAESAEAESAEAESAEAESAEAESAETGSTETGSTETGSTETGSAETGSGNNSQVVVYYFHTTRRCGPCTHIENWTKEVVREDFADQVADGSVTFKAVNVQQTENRHLVEHYGLFSQSVVVSAMDGEQEKEWKNLDQIWQLLRAPEQFKNYIRSGINEYLKG
ncbi:nitrophenyl compound nitroreductase subunit ArsF family protein [Chitinispirillales bacterium ANBcel5]|uniref:nitrophenyl compound nitroreductase subunit ArsF family protein n=1 Tax=Cellulosispirillum alkaliphilum TaxID=3039283 RepID=UPI002A544BDC|nr:nitrophenyl compound nitroreductase subunit ArsF family protein [Chitinispirillales bacterium ANBcel5]